MSTPIVNGKFDIDQRHNGGRMTPDTFEKALEEFARKILLEERIEKINKINEKIKGNNKVG